MRTTWTLALPATALAVLMSGCTQEKADALTAAVNTYEQQANQALTAYEDLFHDYRTLPKPPQTELFEQAYAAVRQNGIGAVKFEDALSNMGQLSNDKADQAVTASFDKLRYAYAQFGRAYAALPQGNVLGSGYVACGRGVLARLTKQLVNFASDVDSTPLYPATLRFEFAEFKQAANKGDAQKDNARKLYERFYTNLTAYEDKHRAALDATLAAVDQGRRLDQLLAHYNDVTLTSILGVAQQGVSYAGTLKGVDATRAANRLKQIKADMDQDPYWSRLESIPLNQVSDCKLGTAN
ncbi:hypothetical protein [Chitinimonas naiadis]